jgi:hypothetical protein
MRGGALNRPTQDGLLIFVFIFRRGCTRAFFRMVAETVRLTARRAGALSAILPADLSPKHRDQRFSRAWLTG